jgi:hypothetical protein
MKTFGFVTHLRTYVLFNNELVSHLTHRAPFIQVVLGPRQVGKTTAVLELSGRLPSYRVIYNSSDLPAPPRAQWIVERTITSFDESQSTQGFSL